MMEFLSLVALIPVLVYVIDAYYEKDTKKGLLYILAFAFFVILGFSLLFLIGWTFALWTPLWLPLILSLKPKKKSKEPTS